MIRHAAILVLAGGLVAAPVAARTMQQKLSAACAADTARFCPAASPGSDEATSCLKTHRDALEPACAHLVDAAE